MNITKNTRTILYIAIAVLIAVGAGYAYNQYQEDKNRLANLSVNEINELNEKERREALESRIKVLEDQVAGFGSNVDVSDKYITLISLAETRLELENYSGAISALDSIPEEKKTNSRVNLAYGKAYFGVGEKQKAKEAIERAKELDDTDPNMWLAYLNINSDYPTEQLNGLYREAISKTKSNLEIMISYAKFSEKIGDKTTAIAAWETAANVNPEKEADYRAEISRLRQ
jgi:tetratricopeptide (TPR) repeat protein